MKKIIRYATISILAATIYSCISERPLPKERFLEPINLEQKIDMDTVIIERYPGDKNKYKLIAPKELIPEYKKKIEDVFKKIYKKRFEEYYKKKPSDIDNILLPPDIIYKENKA